jgi:hypothetical protein
MRFLSVAVLTAVAGLVLGSWGIKAQQPPADCCPQTCKVCVCEPKKNTRRVFALKCEEYCLPHCNFFLFLGGECSCDDGSCGDVRVKHRLVVKKVPDCDTKQCVLKDAPAACPAPCAPAAPGPAVAPPTCIPPAAASIQHTGYRR